jgi:hypothetical protein
MKMTLAMVAKPMTTLMTMTPPPRTTLTTLTTQPATTMTMMIQHHSEDRVVHRVVHPLTLGYLYHKDRLRSAFPQRRLYAFFSLTCYSCTSITGDSSWRPHFNGSMWTIKDMPQEQRNRHCRAMQTGYEPTRIIDLPHIEDRRAFPHLLLHLLGEKSEHA